MRNSVDFPEPLAPSRAMLSPSATSSDSPRSAGRRSYSKPTSCNSKSSAKSDLPSCPDCDTAGTKKCEQPNIVPYPHIEIREDANVATEATRLHGHIHIAAEIDALAEQHARCSGRHSAPLRARQSPYGPALPRFKHLARVFDQKKHITMRHRQHRDRLLRNVKRAQRLEDMAPGSTQH